MNHTKSHAAAPSARQSARRPSARKFAFRRWPSVLAITDLAVAAMETKAVALVHAGRPTGSFFALVQGAAAAMDPDAKAAQFAADLRAGRPGAVMVAVARIREAVDFSTVPDGPWGWIEEVFGAAVGASNDVEEQTGETAGDTGTAA